MRNEYIANPKRVSVYAQGQRAFEEHKHRGYNPYAASNLAFAISWWHGWDTAEEESKDEVTQPRQADTRARIHVPHLSKNK
jgi:hypothetical protein